VDWSDGYVTDVGYVRGYSRELNPSFQAFAIATRGHEAPDTQAAFTKLELGCGYGLSLLFEAAVFPHAQFYGVDFHPDHVTWAKRIAAQAQLDNIHFLETSFADMSSAPLPPMDFIGMHGVWSWISDANREAIVQFLARRLNSGGLVMTSFNTLPGWSGNHALRELMMTKYRSSVGAPAARIAAALQFANDFRALGGSQLAKNPDMSAHLDKLGRMPRRYLAHEYFNQDWHLFYQYQVAEGMAGARLNYLASGRPTENHDRLNLPQALIAMLDGIAPSQRETLKDIYLNRSFRCDIYGRGVENLGQMGAADLILQSDFVLVDSPDKLRSGIVTTPLGQMKLKRDVLTAILDRLAGGPARGQDLLILPGAPPMTVVELLELLSIMVDVGVALPALPRAGLEARAIRTRRLNDALIKRHSLGEDTAFLVSPVSGFGQAVPDYVQLFMLAMAESKDPVPFAWDLLKRVGKRLQKDGQMIKDKAENLDMLEGYYRDFQQDIRPRLQQLGIAE
jgi:SAM-dependent methyltransferase